MAKWDALDWQTKVGKLLCACPEGFCTVWHAQVRAKLNQGCATRCANVYVCACCIFRIEEAPGPRDCAAEASLRQLASTPRGVACGGSNAAIRQPHLFDATFPTTVLRRRSCLLAPLTVPSTATQQHRSQPSARPLPTRRRLPRQSRGLVRTGRPLLLPPPRPRLQPHSHGRPARLRPTRRRQPWPSRDLIHNGDP